MQVYVLVKYRDQPKEKKQLVLIYGRSTGASPFQSIVVIGQGCPTPGGPLSYKMYL